VGVPRQDFIDQMQKLGYAVHDESDGRFWFDYSVEVGRFAGQEIKLGFVGMDDFPLSPPGGMHVSPQLREIHPGADKSHPEGGVHASLFGDAWQYWSRPFNSWPTSSRDARAYLAFVRRLFETQ
jgi:hypothetical protein